MLLRGLPELRRGVLIEVLAPLLDGVLYFQEVICRFYLSAGEGGTGGGKRGGGVGRACLGDLMVAHVCMYI